MGSDRLESFTKELEFAKNEWSTLYALMYYYLAKELMKLGEKGEEALRQGIRNYGRARGARLRKRHEEMGLPISIETLFNYYDLPGDTITSRRQVKLTKDERDSFTFICNLERVWASEGGEEGDYLGSVYCDEFHQAM